jgi:hypothetical protein
MKKSTLYLLAVIVELFGFGTICDRCATAYKSSLAHLEVEI